MNKGDLVWIYEDPFSQTKPEGEARLVKLLSAHRFNQSYWMVRFLKDNSLVARMIVEDDE